MSKDRTRDFEGECETLEVMNTSSQIEWCKICGVEPATDNMGYCAQCYPYDQASDRHHEHEAKQRRENGEI